MPPPPPVPMRLFVLLAVLPALAAPARAQPVAPNTLVVTGEATATAAPDRAVIRLGVQTRAATAAEALRRHEADVAAVLTAVRRFGVADRQIQIEALQLGENYGPNGPEGYVAQRVVAVTTDSLRLVPEMVAAVVSEGANRLDGLTYTLRDPEPVEDRALTDAVGRAREKAERLAAAAGRRLGEVVSVSEQGVVPVQPFEAAGLSDRPVQASVPAQPGAYSAGTTSVRAVVVVQYRLED